MIWLAPRRLGLLACRARLCDTIKRYNTERVDALYDRAKPGQPRHLSLSHGQERELSASVMAEHNVKKEGISA